MSGASPAGTDPGSVGGPGLLETGDRTASILFRRFLRHPIEDVWGAITEPAQVEIWFMARLTRVDAPGGPLEMEHPNGVRARGRVLEWHPPRTYEYEWNLPPGPSQPLGETSIVRWDLAPTEGGTLVVLTHRLLTPPTAAVFSRGLSVFLDRLSAHLDGTPLPDPPWLAQSRGTEAVGRPR
ncbi:MAG: SRPBCC domain-containing protein [Thermoplasmata archaeon]